jgi:acetyl esterase/lipase
MAIKEAKNASLSEVDPEFAPFIPGINERFEEIWKFKTAQELRDKFRGSRQSYPHSIPKEGFEITHRNVPVTDGSEVEVRIYKPEGVTGILPVFYMIHGGGTFGYNDY